MADLLTIGEVSRRSGVASSALRFYEDRGLILRARRLRPSPLPAAGSAADRVHRLRAASGLTLDEIGKELDKLPEGRAPTNRDWSRLSSQWVAIDERIAELERLKLGLTECIGCGCLSLERCKLANPEDRAARHGPGPRYWIGDRPLNG